jgi:hypothetical protein
MAKVDFPAAHSMDTEWFAIDGEGKVAVFRTFEDGPIPLGLPSRAAQREEPVIGTLLRAGTRRIFDLSSFTADGKLYECAYRDYSTDLEKATAISPDDLLDKPYLADEEKSLLWLPAEASQHLASLDWINIPCTRGVLAYGRFPALTVLGLLLDGKLLRGWLCVSLDPVALGVFTYEYHGMMDPKDPYTRVGLPSLPLRIDELPEAVQHLARETSLPRVDFARDAAVQVIDHLPCEAWHMPELSHEDASPAQASPPAPAPLAKPSLLRRWFIRRR